MKVPTKGLCLFNRVGISMELSSCSTVVMLPSPGQFVRLTAGCRPLDIRAVSPSGAFGIDGLTLDVDGDYYATRNAALAQHCSVLYRSCKQPLRSKSRGMLQKRTFSVPPAPCVENKDDPNRPAPPALFHGGQDWGWRGKQAPALTARHHCRTEQLIAFFRWPRYSS